MLARLIIRILFATGGRFGGALKVMLLFLAILTVALLHIGTISSEQATVMFEQLEDAAASCCAVAP